MREEAAREFNVNVKDLAAILTMIDEWFAKRSGDRRRCWELIKETIENAIEREM